VAISEAVRIAEGQRVRMVALEDKMVIEPVRDAIWLALHGRKIGRMLSEEVEEESLRGQERLSKR
jgi:virulence-associated protein VagC